MSIFRAYDIRGTYPGQVNEKLAEKIGKAFGTKFPGKVVVGMDARNSGPALKEAVIKGLLSTGANVIDIGMVPTPLLCFAVVHYGADGGIQVSASHNPSNYNGFKFYIKGGIGIGYDDGINEIEKMAKGESFAVGEGKVEKRDAAPDYIKHTVEKTSINRPLKVVIDAGNGSGGILGPEAMRKAGCEVIELFCEPDGNFPNHEADPLKKGTLKDMQAKVRETGADLGVAYDGDGDRLGIVDENGECIDTNKIFVLLLREALKKAPGSKILYEVITSRIVEDEIKKNGGIPVLERVGHTFIHRRMHSDGCVFGGETSAHYFYKDNYNYDDAIFAGLKVAEIATKGKLSELVKTVPEYFTSNQYRPHCADDRKFELVQELGKRLKDRFKIIDIDGVKAVFDDGWFIVRASNTAPQLVIRWEATTKEAFERIEKTVREELGALGVKLD
ncbi:MAG: phosphomannomutase/phosphoglucomutase [Candidatus Aenigmarchaeota archaeon]